MRKEFHPTHGARVGSREMFTSFYGRVTVGTKIQLANSPCNVPFAFSCRTSVYMKYWCSAPSTLTTCCREETFDHLNGKSIQDFVRLLRTNWSEDEIIPPAFTPPT
ncbi:unnamed protein product [Sphacelaria rigidula]